MRTRELADLGHLLLTYDWLDASPHSVSGLMRGPWQRDDLKPKAREMMQFAAEDAGGCELEFLERLRKSNDLRSPNHGKQPRIRAEACAEGQTRQASRSGG